MSTNLAMQAEAMKAKKTLLAEYAEYAQVFSKEATGHIPPSRPYDHTINLDESFIPKIGKLYPLSVKEREAADEFINENLRSGKIRLSKSPKLLLSSSSKKRMEASDLAKITDIAIAIQFEMLIPSP